VYNEHFLSQLVKLNWAIDPRTFQTIKDKPTYITNKFTIVLYGYETQPFTQEREYKQRLYENKVIRKIFMSN
jgi:hypothetical protein